MTSIYQVILPDGQAMALPAHTVAAIAQARASYAAPLWELREEGVLKLGGHQWIEPGGVLAARARLAAQAAPLTAAAWKLFNRDWQRSAEAYWADTERYPHQPRHLGRGVIPLVDEDRDSQQIGWVRVLQVTAMDANFAVFVQFAILELFAPQPLPAEYA